MSDPLIRLPYELWVLTMRLVVQDDYAGPLCYLAVSSLWSESLLKESILWTNIIVYGGEDEIIRVHTFLHLSHSCGLHVQLYRIGGDEMEDILRVISSQSHRLESLNILNPLHGYECHSHQPPNPYSMVLTRLFYPSIIRSTKNQVINLLNRSPLLKRLKSVSGGLPIPLFPTDFVKEGGNIFHLESVTIEGLIRANIFYGLELDYRAADVVEFRNNPQVAWTTHLNQISSLKDLKDIYIRLPDVFLNTLLPALGFCQALTTLRLEIYWPRDDKGDSTDSAPDQQAPHRMPWPWSILKLQCIHIVVEWIPLAAFNELVESFKDSRATQNLDIFSMKLYPTYIDWTGKTAQVHSLLHSVSRVRKLNIRLETFYPNSKHLEDIATTTIEYNHLLHLTLFPLSLLQYLDTPSLLYLYIVDDDPFWQSSAQPRSGSYANWGYRGLSKLIIDHIGWALLHKSKLTSSTIKSLWSSLTHLEFRSDHIPEDILFISSLQFINIDDRSDRAIITGLNKLLQFALHRPWALPNLSRFELISYPSWELPV